MKTLYIGDTHGDWEILHFIIEKARQYIPDIGRCVVVGDFGYWPSKISGPGSKSGRIYFIDGNHEFHALLKHSGQSISAVIGEGYETCYHIPRGYFEGHTLFLGGAHSVDRKYRELNVDWFVEEDVTESDVVKALKVVENQTVNVLITHDTTNEGYDYLDKPFQVGQNLEAKTRKTREKIQRVYNAVKPKIFIHGHWHQFKRYLHNGCFHIALRHVNSMPEYLHATNPELSENHRVGYEMSVLVQTSIVIDDERAEVVLYPFQRDSFTGNPFI